MSMKVSLLRQHGNMMSTVHNNSTNGSTSNSRKKRNCSNIPTVVIVVGKVKIHRKDS